MSIDRNQARAYQTRALRLLANWAMHAKSYWYTMPDAPALGCYGTGFNSWGVQTNQKFLAAMAALSVLGTGKDNVSPARCDEMRELALKALRFSLASHRSGSYHRTDGTQWGHTWISGLGVERMMYGVYLLDPWLTAEDRTALRRVLTSEAEWICYNYERGRTRGVPAGQWNADGRNAPESNLWSGALLWRASVMYPDHEHVQDWQEQAHRFLLNSISVPADADDQRIVAGRPIRDWHIGPNFFSNYALDHHGYLNVGYMAICLSNAAMLHFDMVAHGWPRPDSLYHHNLDLWQVMRRMVFADGRLARIGGDSRVRYAYCQEYLLPTLPYVATLGEAHAEALIDAQLTLIETEAAANDDGSFYGSRLTSLKPNAYYYTRLESDRAVCLGMLATYLGQIVERGAMEPTDTASSPDAFERSARGAWSEPEHGAALHRSATRLASFAWRAYGLGQGMCQPPDDGNLTDWYQNLGGEIRFYGDLGETRGRWQPHRTLLNQRIDTFAGGFATMGAILEGVGVTLDEGYTSTGLGVHQIAFVALPDAHMVVGLQRCATLDQRAYLAMVKGLHLNLVNDLYNRFERRLTTASGEVMLTSPPEKDDLVWLAGRWANIEGKLGVIGIYGADELVIDRSATRRGGRYETLYVDQICFHHAVAAWPVNPNTTILDVGWAVVAGANAVQTEQVAATTTTSANADHPVRAISITGLDGRTYIIIANFGSKEINHPIGRPQDGAAVHDLTTNKVLARRKPFAIAPGSVRVLVLEQ